MVFFWLSPEEAGQRGASLAAPRPGSRKANAQLIDSQALLGHESIATTRIYTHAGQERLSRLVEGM